MTKSSSLHAAVSLTGLLMLVPLAGCGSGGGTSLQGTNSSPSVQAKKSEPLVAPTTLATSSSPVTGSANGDGPGVSVPKEPTAAMGAPTSLPTSGPPITSSANVDGPTPTRVSAAAEPAPLLKAGTPTPNIANVVFQNVVTREVGIWLLDSVPAPVGWTAVGSPSAGWTLRGVADYNNDGVRDFLFQENATGALGAWTWNGLQITGWLPFNGPSPGWNALGVADMDGDGKADILFQNPSIGAIGFWKMNGSTVIGWVPIGNATVGWEIKGVADFNGDEKSDILFQETATRNLGYWTWDGTQVTGWVALSTPSAGWDIKAAADFNGDSQPDIMFQNSTTNEVGFWALTGSPATVTGWTALGTAASRWVVQCGVSTTPKTMVYTVNTVVSASLSINSFARSAGTDTVTPSGSTTGFVSYLFDAAYLPKKLVAYASGWNGSGSSYQLRTMNIDAKTGATADTGVVLQPASAAIDLVVDKAETDLYGITFSNAIDAYRINDAGGLTFSSGNGYSALTLPNASLKGVAMSPSGNRLFIGTDNTFYPTFHTSNKSIYTTDRNSSNGFLNNLQSRPTLHENPHSIVVHPSGQNLYTVTYEAGVGSFLESYFINADGSLAQNFATPGSPPVVSTNIHQNSRLAISPNGKFVYCAMPHAVSPSVTVFSVDSGYRPTKVQESIGNGLLNPSDLQVDPTGAFLYVANSGDSALPGNTYNQYRIDQNTGQLTFIRQNTTGTGPARLKVVRISTP